MYKHSRQSKIISVILALLLIISAVPLAALQAAAAWNGSSTAEPSISDGYYQIDSPEKLAWFAVTVNNGSTAINGKLNANIDLGGYSWTPIGNNTRQYAGHFDGQGYTVSNLNLTTTAVDRGLFGKSNASSTIENIKLFNVSASGNRDYTGGVVGVIVGSTVRNCHVTGVNMSNTYSYMGGIVGQTEGTAVIDSCSVTGTSSAKTISTRYYVGGIVGRLSGGTLTITNCTVTNVDIGYSATDRAGGIVGDIASGKFIMSNCLAENITTTCAQRAGGLSSAIRNNSEVRGCTVKDYNAMVSTTGNAEAGGLFGYSDGGETYIANCLVDNVNITTSGARVAGVVGYANNKISVLDTIVQNSYFKGTNYIAGITGSLMSGGWLARCGVVDSVLETTLASNADAYMGGLVGNCGWAAANTVENCYVAKTALNGAARIIGGLIGTINNAAHTVKECAVYTTAIQSSAANTGAFYGIQSSGVTSNCYSYTASSRPLAGSGSSNGITAVTAAQMADGTVAGYLNALTNIWSVSADGYPFVDSDKSAPPEKNAAGYYELFTSYQLEWYIGHINNTNTSANAILMADIDLKGKAQRPIGNNNAQFSGSFDGNGYTVSNFYVSTTGNDVGFFGSTSVASSIKNLTLNNVYIYTTGDYVGGIAGIHRGAIENCHVNGAYVYGRSYVGGIAGYLQGAASVKNCSVSGTVPAKTITATSTYAGGLVGFINTAPVAIENCNVTNLTITAGNRAAGIYVESSGKISVDNCHVKDCSISVDTRAGGIAHYLKNNTEVNNSTVTNVTITSTNTGTAEIAGIGGYTATGTIIVKNCIIDNIKLNGSGPRAGGVIGYADTRTDISDTIVKNSSVRGTVYVGGLSGTIKNGSQILRCGVIDTSVTSTLASTTANAETGGFIGTFAWTTVNTLQYCYATGVTVSTNGRLSGGFIGKVGDANHIIRECYANVSFSNTATLSGSFIGERNAGAAIQNCFAANSAGFPLVGSTVAGQNGTITGITAQTPAQVADGTLNGLLNEVTDVWTQSSAGYPVIDLSKSSPPNLNNENYYEIYSAYQLEWYKNHVNANNPGANAILMTNINLNSKPFSAIGSNTNRFSGTFDGNGFAVNGLNITSTGTDQGLFSSTASSAVIKDLTLNNIYISTTANYAGGVVAVLRGRVENCHVNGLSVSGSSYVGGIAGQTEESASIINCSVTGTASAKSVHANGSYSGGIIGRVANNITLRDCSVSGISVSAASERTGGIYGDTANKMIIENCHVNDVTSNASRYMGGIGFGLRFASTLKNSSVSGFTATASSTNDCEIGGLFGCTDSNSAVNTIENCVVDSVSLTAGGTRVAGVIGFMNNRTDISDTIVKDSYFKGTSRVAGFVGTIMAGASIYRSGVINSTIESSITSATTDADSGGFIGLCGWGTPNTVKFCYATGITLKGGGRNMGGFIGKIDSSNHTIKENYADAISIQSAAAYVGTFAGYKTTGTFSECFASAVASLPTVGSATAGAPGATAGVTAVTRNDVFDGNLTDMLNAYTGIWQQSDNDYIAGHPEIGNTEPPQEVNGFYEIYTNYQLELFMQMVNSGNITANARLMNDINLNGKEFTAIGSDSYRYGGKFDGNSFAINNLKINSSGINNQGLFGSTSPAFEVYDLTLNNVQINSSNAYVGAIAGVLRGSVDNCHVNGLIVNGAGGDSYVGGFAGQAENTAAIKNCTLIGTPSMKTITANGNYVGGLVGNVRTASFVLENCTVSDIEITTANRAGGLIGDTVSGSARILDCHASNIIINVSSRAGGLIYGFRGTSYAENSSVTNLRVNATATAENEVGGLFGYSDGSAKSLKNCSVNGAVLNGTGTRIGGAVGYMANRNDISGTIIKDIVISGKTQLGGFSGNIGYGSEFLQNGVVNVTITASGISATVDEQIGGFIGVAGWDNINTVQYCYAVNVTINAVGRQIGGFFGNLNNANHSISECYADAVSITSTAANVGTFAGYKASGTITDCFASSVGLLPVAGYNSNPANTSVQAVTHEQVLNGALTSLLNSVTPIWQQANNDFIGGYPEIGNAEPPALVGGYYEIYNAYQLEWFRKAVNGGESNANAKLMNDINLKNKIFTPIGHHDMQYGGHFDGQGYTISNLDINNTSWDRGLFGKTKASAVIENVNLYNVTMTANRIYTGTLVGYVEGSVIRNCHVTGINSLNANDNVGGLIGAAGGTASIVNCSVTGIDGANTIKGASYVGGIVGRTVSNITITACEVNNLNIAITGQRAGGIYGDIDGGVLMIDGCKVKDLNISCVYWAGGIGFGIRNGSTVKNSTVENLKITASSTADNCEISGLFGTASGNAGTITDCSAADIELTAGGGRIGGAIGYLNNRTDLTNVTISNAVLTGGKAYVGGMIGYSENRSDITNSHVTNATIKGTTGLGGFLGNLRNGSVISNCSVTDADITSTNTNANTEINVGGFVGVCGWGTANSLSYCLANGIEITAIGRNAGGFFGKIDTANHIVDNCYSHEVTINGANVYAGSFIGNRQSGTYTDSFSAAPVYNITVGSATADTAGNLTSIGTAKVKLSDIASETTADLIAAYVEGRAFVTALDKAPATYIKQALIETYNKMNGYLFTLAAELNARLEPELDAVIAPYDEYSRICLFNYKEIGVALGLVSSAIYTNNIPLESAVAAKYERYLQILNEYNDYMAFYGYNSYFPVNVNYPTRPVFEDDMARFESPAHDYVVTEERMENVVNKLDSILQSGDFASLAGLENTLDITVEELLKKELYTNDIANSIIESIYPMICNELTSVVSEAEVTVLGIKISLKGKTRELLEEIVEKFGLALYPKDLSTMLDAEYSAVKAELTRAGTDWNSVIWENMDWGVSGKDSFINVLGNALRGIAPVVVPLLTDKSFNKQAKADLLLNVDAVVKIDIPAVSAYENAVVELLEMLNISGLMNVSDFNNLTSSDDMIDAIAYPLFNWVEDVVAKAPIATIASLLPNIAYCLEFGMLENLLRSLKTAIRYDISGEVDVLLDKIKFNLVNDTIDVSVYDMLSADEDDMLYGADLSGFDGLVGIIIKAIGVENITLPPIDNTRLASMGSVVTLPSAKAGNERYYIEANKAKTFYSLLNYIFTIAGNEDLIRGIFATLEDIPVEEVQLDDDIINLINELSANPGNAIAALVELCNPVEYPMREIKYDKPGTGTAPSALYSKYWTRDKAKYVVDNLDGFIDNVLELLGLDSVDVMLNDLLGDELFTNKNLTSLVLSIKDLVNDLGSSADKIFELLQIDLSLWDSIGENHNFGFEDGNKDGFITAFCETVAPVNNLIALLLADRDFSILDGQVTALGSEGYKYGIIPILEALGCDPADIVSGEDYLEHYYNGNDESSLIRDIVTPVFNLLEKIFEDPVYTVFSILPEIICFVESGALSDALVNTLHPVFALLDTIRPLYNLEINLDFNLSSIVTDLLENLTGDSGFVIPADFDLRNFASGAPEDLLTVILRYAVQIVFHDDNYGLIAQAISEKNDFTADETKTLMAAFDALRSIAIGLNGEDIDMVLYVLYYIFYGLNIGSGSTLDFLNNFNASWKALMDMLLGSDSDIVNGFGKVLKDTLNKYFGGIFDEGGIGSDGALTFFQKIIAFFQKIIDFFKNLFN